MKEKATITPDELRACFQAAAQLKGKGFTVVAVTLPTSTGRGRLRDAMLSELQRGRTVIVQRERHRKIVWSRKPANAKEKAANYAEFLRLVV